MSILDLDRSRLTTNCAYLRIEWLLLESMRFAADMTDYQLLTVILSTTTMNVGLIWVVA